MRRSARLLVFGLLLTLSAFVPGSALALNIGGLLGEIAGTLDRTDAALQQTFGGSSSDALAAAKSSTWDKLFGGLENKWESSAGASGHEALKKDPGFVRDAKMLNRLGTVARRLVPVCERKELNYHFAVLDSKELNAFALPGGYVYVTKGLLEAAKTDDELAAVVAHELGHVNKKHSVRQAEKAGIMTAVVALMTVTDETKKYQKAAAIASYFANLKFSRVDEFEADRCAVEYAHKAGYNPNGLITFFNRINRDNALTKVTKYFSTHPPTTDRINAAQEQIRKLGGKPAAQTPTTAQTPATTTTSSPSTTGSGNVPGIGDLPSGSTTQTQSGRTMTLQEAYERYLFAKQNYEFKVSQQAPTDEIMKAFEEYQTAKVEYLKLRNGVATNR
ncbi:MAG TPA: M48 family metalloprotease [Candidatus Ozemobacteraceae bacterium]|nr:M48 family metalloprotease [Candidatus Ozemobacteraceae bacterium]